MSDEVVSGYRLLRRLGSRSGEAWEARSERTGDRLQLELVPGVADPRYRAAWVRELRMAGRVRSPHLAPVLDAGPLTAAEDSRWFVVTPPVDGPTLAERLAEGPLPPRLVLEAGVQLAGALAHLHELALNDFGDDPSLDSVGGVPGLLYRHLEPSRVVLTGQGRFVVTGVGLWRVAGSPEWMAEEANDPAADARVDVFGLGATVYALATGTAPFASREDLRRVEDLLLDPAFFEAVDRVVPGLGDALYPCLRRQPGDRWRGLRDVESALAGLRAPRPSSLPSLGLRATLGAPPPPERTARLAPAPTPRAAPPPRVGRGDEIAAVVKLLRGVGRVVVLDGALGLGRSTVAAAVAEVLGAEFSGGVVPVDLVGVADRGLACWAVARALGVDLDPSDPVGRLGRVLARRGRCLVVLDDPDTCGDAAASLVGEWMSAAPEARFLSTGPLPGLRAARRLQLSRLSGEVAVELLGRTVGDLAAVELAQRLQGLPAALLLVRAAIRGERTFDGVSGRIAERMSLHRDPLGVAAEVAKDLVPEWARAAIRQLAVLHGPFGELEAAGVLDLSAWPEAPFAPAVLDALGSAGLLERRGGRFLVPEAIRVPIVSTRLSLDLELAALRRGQALAQLGTDEAARAIAASVEGYSLAEVEDDVPDLAFALRQAIDRRDPRYAVPLFLAFARVVRPRCPVALVAELGDAVLLLPGLTDRDHGRVHACLAGVHEAAKNASRSATHRDRALLFASRAQDRRTEAALRSRAVSVSSVEQALDLAASVGEAGLTGRILVRLASVLQREGRAVEAHERLLLAVEELAAAGDPLGEAEARLALGVAKAELQDVARGLEQLELAARGFEEQLDTTRSASTRVVAAGIALELGRLTLAREQARLAGASLRQVGDTVREAEAWSLLGEIEGWSGATDEALQLLDDAERVQRRTWETAVKGGGTVDPVPLAVTACRWAAIHLEVGRTRDARTALDEALPRVADHPAVWTDLQLQLTAVDLQDGSHDDARARLLGLLSAARRSPGHGRLGRAMWMLGRCSVRDGEPDTALERLETAVAELSGRSLGWASLARLDLARTLDARGKPEAASELVERAVSELREAGFLPALGLALATRARLHRLRERDQDAEADLREARELAARCGMRARSPLQKAIDAAT